MRGIWVQSYAIERAEQADTLMARLRSAGFDAIFYNVHERGARYNSAFYSPSTSFKNGFDALGYLIKRGDALGIQIHAWLAPGLDLLILNHAWDIANVKGVPSTVHGADFSLSEVRQRAAAVAADIVSKYDVAGIHLDYIRYPNPTSSFLPANFFSAEDVTQTVQAIEKKIGSTLLTAAVKRQDWDQFLQDWPAWLDDSLIDRAIPMAYHIETLRHDISKWPTAHWERIIPGLAIIDTHQSGEPLKTPSLITEEINICKEARLEDFLIFDQRISDAQLARIAEIAPPPQQNGEASPYDDIVDAINRLTAEFKRFNDLQERLAAH